MTVNQTTPAAANHSIPDESKKYIERWHTPEGKTIAEIILPKILNHTLVEDWIPDLKGLPYIDELTPRENEPFARDLRGFNFKHQHLSKAIFTHCYLDYANFEHAILDYVHMRGASMQKAIFKRASMRKAHLWNAGLERAVFAYTDLSEADMGDANLREADFWWARMDEANLRGADLGNANLRWARMPLVDLWNANITGAKFEGTNLNGIKVNEDTNWGLIEIPPDLPIFKSISNFLASLITFSRVKIKTGFLEMIYSTGSFLFLLYWGKPTPKLYFEKMIKTKEEYKIARDVYRQFYEACKTGGLGDQASWFFYRAQVCRRRYLYNKWSLALFFDYFIFDSLSGYGERPRWVIGTMFNVVFIFALLNWAAGVYGGLFYNGAPFYDIGFLGSLYFSIESFTTVGYGDIAPNHYTSVGRVLRFFNSIEALIGNLLMALALVTYTRIAIRD